MAVVRVLRISRAFFLETLFKKIERIYRGDWSWGFEGDEKRRKGEWKASVV